MERSWTATYRLQLHAGFPLRAAAEVLPYLKALGVSHVYLSPCLQATSGSTHGYDVTDPSKVSEALGGEAAWSDFQSAVKANGLGVLLDIVPNHMSTSTENGWWSSVLAHGPFSPYRRYFDIMPNAIAERWLISICTLGAPYGAVLAAGDLRVELVGNEPVVRYFEHQFPIGRFSWRHFLGNLKPALTDRILDLGWLRSNEVPDQESMIQFRSLSEEIEEQFSELVTDAGNRGKVEAICAEVSADPDAMHAVLLEQFYRLCWWKLEGEIVNYRRFFNIGSLVGVRVEDPEVFAAAHARIAAMVQEGDIDGLRIDHPDGLQDPHQVFQRLRELQPDGRLYVEKILDAEEMLRDDWPVDGTVGYEFLSRANRLWMDEHKADAFTAAYADFTGHPVNYPALVREKKLEIVEQHFRADLERLATLGLHIAQTRWENQDLSRVKLRDAIKLLTVVLPVYRTYLTADTTPAGEADSKIITDAVLAARALSATYDSEAFDFLERVLTRQLAGTLEDEFVSRWQQLAPAIMAKGAEDTTFYCFDRLVSCNEVGAQPSQFGISTESFHQFCSHLQSRWPNNLLTTSTHDTKRSGDVRARISVLTEIPDRWTAALHRWAELNSAAWNGREPDRHAEYLLYQTLLGAWPISFDRAWGYMLKACREAKINTSWHEPNELYETAIRDFTEAILASADFVADFADFVEPLVTPGRVNSLSQTLLKMTAPGTPDFYQGADLWDLSLVDPDNRRPVDFKLRADKLAACESLGAQEIMAGWEDGLPKLWMIRRTLEIRRRHPEFFGADAVYQPRSARGSRLGHLISFQRGDGILVLVPRFTLSLDGKWDDTVFELPEGVWKNVFTERLFSGENGPVELFGDFPVALFIRS